jgi:hypothetical protein
MASLLERRLTMSSTLDERADKAIETTGEWPEGVDFTFPRRELGRVGYVLWLLVAVLVALGYWLLAGPIVGVVRQRASVGSLVSLAVWSFLAFQLCRYPLWHVLALLFGRREIGLRSDWIYIGDRVGWLRRNKRRPLSRIRQLQLVDLVPKSRSSAELRATLSAAACEVPLPAAAPGSLVSDLVRHLNALTAVLDDGSRILIAPAYPRPLLAEFSQELSKQITIARREGGIDDSDSEPEASTLAAPGDVKTTSPIEAPPIAVPASIGIPELIAEAKHAMRKAREPDLFAQPPGSVVEVEQFPDGVTFRIPPLGVWKGSAGMFPFGVLFGVVTGGFTILFAGAGAAQGGAGAGGPIFGAIGIMGIFWLISGGMLLGGYVLGTRETALAIVDDKVMVMQTGLRRAKRREWPRSDVKTARVGASGTEINDKPVLELQLLGADDKKLFGMLMGRDVPELHWMATLLRQALKTGEPASPDQAPPAEADAPNPVAPFEYRGMTIEERLKVSRLSDDFVAAVQQGDRDAMLQILERVQLPADGAAAYADTVLANPRRQGF